MLVGRGAGWHLRGPGVGPATPAMCAPSGAGETTGPDGDKADESVAAPAWFGHISYATVHARLQRGAERGNGMRRRHLLGAVALRGCAAAGSLPATPAVPAFDAGASP